MRSSVEYEIIYKLSSNGLNNCQVSRQTGIPRGTIRDILNRERKGKDKYSSSRHVQMQDLIKKIKTNSNKQLCKAYAYILGVYFGDGSLFLYEKKQVYRLRVSCDTKYPKIIEEISKTISIVMPRNKIGKVNRYWNGKLSCIDISCYSSYWKELLPSHNRGKKHTYSINLEDWQKSIIKKYTKDFVRGLIQTDGSRYLTQGRTCYNFSQRSKDITEIFLWAVNLLGLKPTIVEYDDDNGKCYKHAVSFYKRQDVEYLDTFIGKKE